jgi:hypothetical protein
MLWYVGFFRFCHFFHYYYYYYYFITEKGLLLVYRLSDIKFFDHNLRDLNFRHNCNILQAVGHAWYAYFSDVICCKFNMRGSKILLVTVIKKEDMEYFCNVVLLFHIVWKLPEICSFRKYITIDNFKTLNEVTVFSLPPHDFARPPCCYYWVQKIKIYGPGIFSDNILTNFL